MPQLGHKGNARTRLADVLADIRNSRAEQLSLNQDNGPTPAKRRSAVNYVELSGHSAKQTRSSVSRPSLSTPQSNIVETSIVNHQKRTYNLRLFGRVVDLAPFIQAEIGEDSDASLYAICRDWTASGDTAKNNHETDAQHAPSQHIPTDQLISNSNHQSPHKVSEKLNRRNEKIDNGDASNASSTPEILDEKLPDAEVHTLPAPTPMSEVLKRKGIEHNGEDIDLRIPVSVRDFKPASDLSRTFDKTFNTMARHECLQINRERWSVVRKNWTRNNEIYESRYEDSFRVINEIFRR